MTIRKVLDSTIFIMLYNNWNVTLIYDHQTWVRALGTSMDCTINQGYFASSSKNFSFLVIITQRVYFLFLFIHEPTFSLLKFAIVSYYLIITTIKDIHHLFLGIWENKVKRFMWKVDVDRTLFLNMKGRIIRRPQKDFWVFSNGI